MTGVQTCALPISCHGGKQATAEARGTGRTKRSKRATRCGIVDHSDISRITQQPQCPMAAESVAAPLSRFTSGLAQPPSARKADPPATSPMFPSYRRGPVAIYLPHYQKALKQRHHRPGMGSKQHPTNHARTRNARVPDTK